jgi:hypothetical protein
MVEGEAHVGAAGDGVIPLHGGGHHHDGGRYYDGGRLCEGWAEEGQEAEGG